jgi:antitoxin ParD1/3/4
MSFPLPPEFERAVLDRVRSGRYASPEDVLAAMVEALDAREAEHEEKLEELRRDIRVGLDQLDRGERLSRGEVLARLREARPGARI